MEGARTNKWIKPRDRLVALLETRWSLLLICLLFAGFVGLAVHGRGPFRRATYYKGWTDVLPMYVQTKAWMAGMDPYSESSRLAVWPREVYAPHPISLEYLSLRAGAPTPYPAFTYVPLVPFALLPWPIANASMLFLDFVLFFLVLRTLADVSQLVGFRRVAWVASALLFAPFYAGMDSNNIAVLAVECSLVALGTDHRRRDTLTALLLAVSIALKPQIGFCFLVYFVWSRRWRVTGLAVALVGVATALSLLRMYWAHVAWMSNYMRDSALFFRAGGVNDFRPQNLYNFDLINLQVVLYPLLGSDKAAHGVALAAAGLLFLAWWVFFRKSGNSSAPLVVGCLSAIALLPVYHRFYDATLLLLPLCWYVANFCSAKLSDRWSLLLWVPFFIPFASVLRWWASNHPAPGWFLETFVRLATNWCLLGLALFLLKNLYDASRDQGMRLNAVQAEIATRT